MTGYVQEANEVWVPLALARKDGTCPRIFCVLKHHRTVSKLVRQRRRTY